MTTLSLIIPVRNAGPYIGDALSALTRNNEPDFELIVVDDASTDETAQVVEDYRQALPNLSVIRQAQPGGPSAARNAGLAAAQGRYLTFLDGDDWIAPGYLRRLVDAIESLGVDFVRVDHVQVEGRNRTPVRAPEARRGVALPARAGILPIDRRSMVDYPFSWAGIFRSDLGELLVFPEDLHTAEDRPWIWRLHREASTFAVVSLMELFYRRLVTASLTQIGDERQLHFFGAFEKIFDQLEGDRELQPKAVRQFLGVLARHLTLDRLDVSLRGELERRGRAAVAALPPELVQECTLDADRAAALRAFLPPDHPSLEGVLT